MRGIILPSPLHLKGAPIRAWGSISSHLANGTNPDATHTIDMATAMSQFMQEKFAVPSFDRVERISGKLVPSRARRSRLIWTVHYFLWIRDQRDGVAISTEGTHNDASEVHENPWKPCQPSEDAEEWNGISGIHGASPGVDLGCPATLSLTDGSTVTDKKSNSVLVVAFYSQVVWNNMSLVDS